jgi:4,5-DOPA dioxygenase extradiol
MNTRNRLPVLFVSHGSPMFALEPGTTGPALRAWGANLRQPTNPPVRGVLVMSPHWMARSPRVTGAPQPETWHDFGGFPQPLYHLQYPAPGAPVLAAQVAALLNNAGIATAIDTERPFDHGAWVPLMHLLPEAQVPVVQLALLVGYSPRHLYALGQALQSLRDEGVLIVASGSMTHNLHEFFNGRPDQDSGAEAYVEAFSRWVEAALMNRDVDALMDYRTQAPAAARAHPTDEHFVTLYFALGAAGWAEPSAVPNETREVVYLSREVMYRYLAMDAIAFQ